MKYYQLFRLSIRSDESIDAECIFASYNKAEAMLVRDYEKRYDDRFTFVQLREYTLPSGRFYYELSDYEQCLLLKNFCLI